MSENDGQPKEEPNFTGVRFIAAPGSGDTAQVPQAQTRQSHEAAHAAEMRRVALLSKDDMLAYLLSAITQTDIVAQGMNLVASIDTGTAISVTALEKTREAIDGARNWIAHRATLRPEGRDTVAQTRNPLALGRVFSERPEEKPNNSGGSTYSSIPENEDDEAL